MLQPQVPLVSIVEAIGKWVKLEWRPQPAYFVWLEKCAPGSQWSPASTNLKANEAFVSRKSHPFLSETALPTSSAESTHSFLQLVSLCSTHTGSLCMDVLSLGVLKSPWLREVICSVARGTVASLGEVEQKVRQIIALYLSRVNEESLSAHSEKKCGLCENLFFLLAKILFPFLFSFFF